MHSGCSGCSGSIVGRAKFGIMYGFITDDAHQYIISLMWKGYSAGTQIFCFECVETREPHFIPPRLCCIRSVNNYNNHNNNIKIRNIKRETNNINTCNRGHRRGHSAESVNREDKKFVEKKCTQKYMSYTPPLRLYGRRESAGVVKIWFFSINEHINK